MKRSLILFFLFFGFWSQAQILEVDIKNESAINTSFNEFSPIQWEDYFIYVSSGKEDKYRAYYDLKFSATNLNNQMLRSAFLPPSINSDYHEGPACFDANTSTLYFTRSHFNGTELKTDSNQKVQLKIYKTKRENGLWSNAELVKLNKEGFSYCHPSLSPSGKVMIFASDEKSEDGKMDLWKAKLIDGEWKQVMRLDSTINRLGNQWFPFLYNETTFIYASQNVEDGQGLDMYIGALDESLNKEKTILPFPFNSNFDDFGIWVDAEGQNGFFSSNRAGGQGGDDIYSFVLQENIFEKYSAKARIDPIEENEIVRSPVVKENTNSNVRIPETTPQRLTNTPSKISTEIGQISVFDRIYFDRESDRIRPEATKELDELFLVMLNNPALIVQLSAHTDSRGSESFNQALSDRRAETAKRYLVEKGISSTRIIPLGFGESRLRNHCTDGVVCDEEQHRYNRRLEIKVIDN